MLQEALQLVTPCYCPMTTVEAPLAFAERTQPISFSTLHYAAHSWDVLCSSRKENYVRKIRIEPLAASSSEIHVPRRVPCRGIETQVLQLCSSSGGCTTTRCSQSGRYPSCMYESRETDQQLDNVRQEPHRQAGGQYSLIPSDSCSTLTSKCVQRKQRQQKRQSDN